MTETYKLQCELTKAEVVALCDLDHYANQSHNFTAAETEVLSKIISSIDPTPPPLYPYPSAEGSTP